MRWLIAMLLLGGCPTPDETDDTEPILCEADGVYDIQVIGAVEDDAGAVAGATVELWDRGWSTPIAKLGEGVTDANGGFTFLATGVTDVGGCWGTVLDYTLVATEGARTGEKKINTSLHAAIGDDLESDTSRFPIKIQ